jgi:hypothetical protein
MNTDKKLLRDAIWMKLERHAASGNAAGRGHAAFYLSIDFASLSVFICVHLWLII